MKDLNKKFEDSWKQAFDGAEIGRTMVRHSLRGPGQTTLLLALGFCSPSVPRDIALERTPTTVEQRHLKRQSIKAPVICCIAATNRAASILSSCQ